MTPKKWTVNAFKKLFKNVAGFIDSIDKYLTAYKWLRGLLSILGLISVGIHPFMYNKIKDKDIQIIHTRDTLKVKSDSILVAKTVCSKAIDDNIDTAVKYKKLAKVLFMKPIEISGGKVEDSAIKAINKETKK